MQYFLAGVEAVFAGLGPAPYTAPNMPHWNLFEAAKAGSPAGARAAQDHLFANPLYGSPIRMTR
jgi:hypothetical protein